MTHDEVRTKLRDMALEFAPKLAQAVLDRQDYDLQREYATRVNAALRLLQRFEADLAEDPLADTMTLLLSIEKGLAAKKDQLPEEVRGPSVWELIQRPAL